MRDRGEYWPLGSLLLPVAFVAVPVILFWNAFTLVGTFYFGDIVGQFYPVRVAFDRALAEGRLPLWAPNVMGGYPLHAEAEGGFLYPIGVILTWLLAPIPALNYQLLLHLALAGLGTYIYCRAIKLDALPAAVGGSVFMLSGFLVAHLNHVSIVSAAVWLPFVLLLVELMLRRPRVGPYAVLLALVIGIQFTAGHAQVSFLTLLAAGLYVLFGAAWMFLEGEGLGRPLLLLLAFGAAVLLGLGLAAPQLLHTVELTDLSVRSGGLSGDYFLSFSLPPPYIATFLLPFLNGDPLGSTAPATAVEWCGYAGVLPLVLAVYAVVFRRDRQTLFFLLLAVLALALAIGQWNPLYDNLARVPVFNLFRVPARYLYLYTFAVAALSALGIQRLLRPGLPLARAQLWVVPAVLGVVVAGMWVLSLSSSGDLGRLLALWQFLPWIFLVVALALVVVRGRLLLGALPFAVLAVALLGVDLYSFANVFGQTFNATIPRQEMEQTPGVLEALRAEKNPYRVYTHERIYPAAVGVREALAWNYALALDVHSMNGYLPLVLASYREFAEKLPSSARLANLANVKYVLIPQLLADDEQSERENLANPFSPSPVGRRVEFSPLPTVALEVESALSHAADLPDGTTVAEVVVSDGASTRVMPLRAGIETAEWAYERSDVRPVVKHKRPQVVREWPARSGYPAEKHVGYTYTARLRLERQLSLTSVEIRPVHPRGYVQVDRVVLVDAAGKRTPLSHLEGRGDYEIAYRAHEVVAYRNRDALPRAWLVHGAQAAGGEEDAWRRLLASDFDPASEVIIGPEGSPGRLEKLLSSVGLGPGGEAQPAATPPAGEGEGVQVLRYDAESAAFRANLQKAGFLVLADTHYPGWHAYVDGQRVALLRANWLFRAVALPPGEHTVEMRYEPVAAPVGWLVGGLALLGLAVLGLALRFAPAASPTWREA